MAAYSWHGSLAADKVKPNLQSRRGVAIFMRNSINSSEVDFIHPSDALFDVCCILVQLFNAFYRIFAFSALQVIL